VAEVAPVQVGTAPVFANFSAKEGKMEVFNGTAPVFANFSAKEGKMEVFNGNFNLPLVFCGLSAGGWSRWNSFAPTKVCLRSINMCYECENPDTHYTLLKYN
jgi:hypothetical protein